MTSAGVHSSSERSFSNSRNVNISTVIPENQSNNIFVLNKSLIMESHTEDHLQKKSHIHFNRLWSVWYAIIVTILQGYLIVQGLRNYIGCSSQNWKNGFPFTELNMQLIFCGLTLLFLPLFLVSALFKVGNLANDGVKLSARKTTCSSDPTSLFNEEHNNSTMKALWMHGVPISVFIHIITALCLLLPHLLLEAKLIQNQILPKDNLWKSEIDFMFHKNDRLVVLSFINATPHENRSGINENRITDNFDDDIDEFEYDLNPFETHDNLRTFRPDLIVKHGKIATTPKPPFLSSIEDFDLDDDDEDDIIDSMETDSNEDDILREDLELKNEFETHFTVRKTSIPTTTTHIATTVGTTETPTSTKIVSTTEKTTPKMIQTTVTPSTTTEQEVTSPADDFNRFKSTQNSIEYFETSTDSADFNRFKSTLSSNEYFESLTDSEILPSSVTEEPSTISTIKETTSTTTMSTTTSSSTSSPQTQEPISTSTKMNKNNHKTRKHNHKKHQRQHNSPLDVKKSDTSSNENREFRVEDFDNLDPEIEMKLSEKSNTSNNAKKKHKVSNGRQPASERSKIKSTQTTEFDSSEKATPTTKTKLERGKQRNSEVINVKKQTNNLSNSKDDTTSDRYIDFNDSRKIKRKRSTDFDEEENSDEKTENLPDKASPSVDEDQFILKDENGNIITKSPLTLRLTNENVSNFNELKGINKFLIALIGKDEKFDPKQAFSKSPTLEFINLALALLVWSTRYPSVFWESSKAFTLIFSFQLIANSLDILILYAGTEILFKVQTVGEFMTINNQPSPLLLNGIVTLALTLLAFLLIISSSMILYLYGHSRLAAKIRDCKTITLKETDVWSYFSHCASLCFVLALAVVKAPIIHDLSVSYRMSFEKKLLYATIFSIGHIFLWIVVWMALTAKRRWTFKLPILVETMQQTRNELVQPLVSPTGMSANLPPLNKDEETIYWPASSTKLKVSFDNRMPDKMNDHNNSIEYHGTRSILSAISPNPGETDEGEYATLKNTIGGSIHNKIQFSEYDEVINIKRIQNNDNDCYDNTSEEGKLLACVHSESVTYASTRIIEPPQVNTCSTKIYESYMAAKQQPTILAPVAVQVEHQRFLRRGDSGMPHNEALTPKSDTNSTESSASPPERALSESSSGVHSACEDSKEEVMIRARPVVGTLQKSVKPIPAVIEEEPYGRITANMKMSSFKDLQSSSSTLPHNHNRGSGSYEVTQPSMDYPCNTMPALPALNNHYSRVPTGDSKHTTLPSNIRYSTGGETHYMKQMSQIKNNGSPYATGLGNGHHSFSSRYIQREPLPPPPLSMNDSPLQNISLLGINQAVNHNNAAVPTTTALAGINRSYQMVLNEMCANNTQPTGQFPPPPPSIAN